MKQNKILFLFICLCHHYSDGELTQYKFSICLLWVKHWIRNNEYAILKCRSTLRSLRKHKCVKLHVLWGRLLINHLFNKFVVCLYVPRAMLDCRKKTTWWTKQNIFPDWTSILLHGEGRLFPYRKEWFKWEKLDMATQWSWYLCSI